MPPLASSSRISMCGMSAANCSGVGGVKLGPAERGAASVSGPVLIWDCDSSPAFSKHWGHCPGSALAGNSQPQSGHFFASLMAGHLAWKLSLPLPKANGEECDGDF